MDNILVFSDSLSWGIIPNTRKRLDFDKRWPGVCEMALKHRNFDVRVIENCLNGRRTAWSDPYKAGRNGSSDLAQAIEINSPLRLVVLMLGTNDFQSMHNNNAWLSAQGMAKLISIVRQAPIEPDMPIPEILVVAPPVLRKAKGLIASKFMGSEVKSVGLAHALEQVCLEHNVNFLDAETVTRTSLVDGVHLDEDQHAHLGRALATRIHSLLC